MAARRGLCGALGRAVGFSTMEESSKIFGSLLLALVVLAVPFLIFDWIDPSEAAG